MKLISTLPATTLVLSAVLVLLLPVSAVPQDAAAVPDLEIPDGHVDINPDTFEPAHPANEQTLQSPNPANDISKREWWEMSDLYVEQAYSGGMDKK